MSKENIIDHKEEAALAVAEEEKAKAQPEEECTYTNSKSLLLTTIIP